MPKRIATWNPTRGIWATEVHDLLSVHSEPFWETWPMWGTTRDGVAFALPTQALPTDASACSSSPGLPTPRATDHRLSLSSPAGRAHVEAGFGNLPETVGYHLLKTPTTNLATNGGSQHPETRKAGGHGPTLADEVEHLLPTPSTADGMGGHLTRSGERSQELLLPGVAKALATEQLLPTPRAMDGNGGAFPLSRDPHMDNLETRMVRLLPTPNALASNDGEQPETWLIRQARHKARGINGNGMGMPLTIAVQLLPEAGDPTPQPSAGGKP